VLYDILRFLGSHTDFVPELAKYPKSSPKPQNSPKWDLENDAWYVRNFIVLIWNWGRQTRIWRQILCWN